jgi:hypothetical protein
VKRFSTFISIAIIALVFGNCAQIGTLTGGKKDSIPPQMLAGNPAMFDTGFCDKKLTVAFDEYFSLNNAEQEFYSSPPLTKKPEFKIHKRRLVIKLNEKLRDSTTYTFCFGDAVKDFHEGNILKNFKYVFSTGKVVDSLEISGRILDAFSHKPLKKSFVMLYSSSQDSLPLKQKPLYISRTDTLGYFNCDYIKTGKYKLFVLNDLNANLIYDIPEENIAYCDSILIPKVQRGLVSDTIHLKPLKADKNNPKKKTKPKKDSVVVSEKNIYTPNGLRFFSFTEDRLKQYYKSKDRILPGKCLFVYNKPNENPQIHFTNSNSKFITEINKTKDSLTVWIPDSAIYKADTVYFSDSWKKLDSAQHLVDDKQDIRLTYKKPKENLKKNKKIKEPKNFLKIDFASADFDMNKEYSFTAEAPVSKTDISKIRFYQVYDTLVFDAKKQTVKKTTRVSYEKFFISFKRPVSTAFNLIPMNFKADSVWFSTQFNKKRDTVVCLINDSKIIAKDTLKIKMKFDNDFYLKQTQELEDTLTLPVISQKIISVERKTPDIIKLKFEKAPGTDFTVNITGNTIQNWYQFLNKPYDETAVLKITNPEIAQTDSFEINFKIPDKTLSDGTVQYFTSSTDAIFAPPKQYIKSAKRTDNDKIVFAFSSALESEPTLKPLNFTAANTVFKTWFNTAKDTFFVSVDDKLISGKDTLKIQITYPHRNNKKIIEQQTESLILPVDQNSKNGNNNKKTDKDKVPVSVDLPLKFTIVQDTVLPRKYYIKQKLSPGKKYLVKMDSDAIYDIFGNKNTKISAAFTVREAKFYGKITVNLKQIGAPLFPGFYNNIQKQSDSLNFKKLTKGLVIVNLIDEKGNTVRQKIINSDSQIIFDLLPPKEYKLFLIYDLNSNKKWDTGDYLKKIQPEPTLYYRKPIVVKSRFDTQIDWTIKYTD